MAFEKVDVPEGTFIGWGTKPNQAVVGEVRDYSETAGKDYDKEPCPLVTVKLTETAHSFVKGKWSSFEPGTVVLVTCGQPKLKQAIKFAEPKRGNLIKIVLTGLQDTANGEMKLYEVYMDRSHVSSEPEPSSSSLGEPSFGGDAPASAGDDEPPF